MPMTSKPSGLYAEEPIVSVPCDCSVRFNLAEARYFNGVYGDPYWEHKVVHEDPCSFRPGCIVFNCPDFGKEMKLGSYQNYFCATEMEKFNAS